MEMAACRSLKWWWCLRMAFEWWYGNEWKNWMWMIVMVLSIEMDFGLCLNDNGDDVVFEFKWW